MEMGNDFSLFGLDIARLNYGVKSDNPYINLKKNRKKELIPKVKEATKPAIQTNMPVKR